MENKYESTSKASFWAAVVIIVVIVALFILSSCASGKVVDSVTDKDVHTVNTTAVVLDSTSHMKTHHDSVATTVIQRDTIKEVHNVIDSTVVNNTIETIITNTVDQLGNVIGTDKVTVKNIDRDHWRITDNNKQKVSNVTENTSRTSSDSLYDSAMKHIDSLTTIIDSISHSDQKVITQNERTWWEKVWDALCKKFGQICLALLLLGAIWLATRYWTGK